MTRPMLKPEDYDPLTYTGEMNMTKHSLFGKYNLHELILFSAGALGLLGFFLPWLTFQMFGESKIIYGYSFTRDVELLRPHPEVWLLPMLSVFFLGRSLLVAQLRKKTNLPLWPMMILTFIFSFILFAVPVLIEVDADKLIRPIAGVSFLNNAESGWYFAIVGGILAIVGACAALVEPFLAKHYTKKGTTERTAKWGFASVSQVMQPQPAMTGMGGEGGIPGVPSEGAPAGGPSFDYAGAQPEEGQQYGYDQGQYGAQQGWGGGGPDLSQMTPSERKKYEKAMKKQQKEYQKQMYGGGPQF